MRHRGAGVVLAAWVFAASAAGGEVIVLKGGASIELKAPWAQQGNNAILTRADGAMLSVPVSEIDLKATAAANKAPKNAGAGIRVPAQTLVEAARATRAARAVPRAKEVRLTDLDVAHDSVLPSSLQGSEEKSEEKKESAKGAARLDVAGYDQSKAGGNLLVRGSLRNFGGTTATNARMAVTAMDQEGEVLGTGEASLSKGNLESLETVAFTATIPVADKAVGALRFAPQWIAAPLPAPPAEAAAARSAAAALPVYGAPAPAPAGQPQAPAPAPTPYGQGVMYAAPAPPASLVPPADSRTGYIPGASDPASQPKPPQ